MVKSSPSNAQGAGLIPGQRAKIPHALWPKNRKVKQKQHCSSNIVTASIKTLKMVSIKIEKNIFEKKQKVNVGVGVLPKCRDSSSNLGEREGGREESS